jgi:hypothetical protein
MCVYTKPICAIWDCDTNVPGDITFKKPCLAMRMKALLTPTLSVTAQQAAVEWKEQRTYVRTHERSILCGVHEAEDEERKRVGR